MDDQLIRQIADRTGVPRPEVAWVLIAAAELGHLPDRELVSQAGHAVTDAA